MTASKPAAAAPGKSFRRAISSGLLASIVLALCAGAWRWRVDSPLRELRSVETMLAGAYAERRPFELRLPGALYAPVQSQPDVKSEFSRPVQLLEAESRISHALIKDRDNASWLRLRACAEMLDGDYQEAVSTLNRATDAQPDDITLLADLGMSYALRATAGRNIDYSAAIEMLWRFLIKNPDSPVALFNRALVYERMYLFREALEDWKHYLKLDPAGAWANEALSHKQSIEQRVAARREAMRSLADAAGYREALKTGRAWEPEFYLESAVTTWLPASATDADSREALIVLARLLREKHGDKWLEDLLRAKRDERFWSGAAHLATAVKQNLAGDHELALAEAREAERIYRAMGNKVGYLLARYHEVYALYRSSEMKNCLGIVDQVIREAQLLQYGWISGQAIVEKGNCRVFAGDEGGRADYQLGLTEARARGYKTIELRALGILGNNDVLLRNQISLWQHITDRLAIYWEAPYVGNRAQQFYHDLSNSSAALGHRYAAVVLRRASVEEIARTPYRAMEAQNRRVLAGLAERAGLPEEAEREYSTAAEVFARCRRTTTLEMQLFYAEVKRAELQVETAPGAALTRLQNMLPPNGRFPSLDTERMFYQAEGRAKLAHGDREGAAVAFHRAIGCTERKLASLTAEVDRGGPLRASEGAYRGSVAVSLDRSTEEALKLWEWYRAGDVKGTRQPLELRAGLPELSSDLILSYALLPAGGVTVWALRDGRAECKRLAIRGEQIEPVANRFLRECADPRSSTSALRRDGRQLYDWLVAPIEGQLVPGQTLVFETDGPIGSIPLQALIDASGRYLGQRFPIVVSRGLVSYQERSRLKPLTRNSAALIVADPALGGDMIHTFPPLEEAAREARGIAAMLPRARLVSGKESTLAAVKSAVPSMELFHFAGHGISEEADGGLLLAPSQTDGAGAVLLTASKLAAEDWSNCSLAVLSACSTGTGERNSFVNPESLVRGLLNAGVGRVIASRWNVDAVATSGFMHRLYSSIVAGALPSSALRDASEALRSEPSTAHPFYWAAFQLFGYK